MARFVWKDEGFEHVLNSMGMNDVLETIGDVTVTACNAELHAAQAARKQPVEDGYEATLVTGIGDRSRLFINPTTARATAHEAVNNAILKHIPMGEPNRKPTVKREIPRELGRRGGEARK